MNDGCSSLFDRCDRLDDPVLLPCLALECESVGRLGYVSVARLEVLRIHLGLDKRRVCCHFVLVAAIEERGTPPTQFRVGRELGALIAHRYALLERGSVQIARGQILINGSCPLLISDSIEILFKW